MASKVPMIKFHNGIEYPQLGLGTWKSKPLEVYQSVKDAVEIGYRHFDCAHVYQNEAEVGKALKEMMADGLIKREDLRITSKLWNTCHRRELVVPALKKTLENLQLEYLDLYLIHWPMGYKEGEELFPRSADGKMLYSDGTITNTWFGMEDAVRQGLTRSIGLSNFNTQQIQAILDVANIKPVNNQVECHPYLNQVELIEFCRERHITITAYSPLGSPDRPFATPDDPILLEEPRLKLLSEKYAKTPAQILIRYQLERNVLVIPKSVTKTRIASNFEVFDFSISKEDMEEMNRWVRPDGRMLLLKMSADHKDYPF